MYNPKKSPPNTLGGLPQLTYRETHGQKLFRPDLNTVLAVSYARIGGHLISGATLIERQDVPLIGS